MTGRWAKSATSGTRRASTSAWKQVRQVVLTRDGHRCQLALDGICAGVASVVDHYPVAKAEGGTDDPSNLRSLCKPCNARVTAKYAAKVRAAKYDTKRTPEQHPGMRHAAG